MTPLEAAVPLQQEIPTIKAVLLTPHLADLAAAAVAVAEVQDHQAAEVAVEDNIQFTKSF